MKTSRTTRLVKKAASASLCLTLSMAALVASTARAQAPTPQLVDRNLAVRTVTTGLTTPIGIAFLGTSDWLVIEKDTGQVKRVVNGTVQSTVLDLAVNSASERG